MDEDMTGDLGRQESWPALGLLLADGRDPADFCDADVLGDLLWSAIQDDDCRMRVRDQILGWIERDGYPSPRDRWEIELLENPAMVDDVIAAVVDPLERLDIDSVVDVGRRPHPVDVELEDGSWRCDACGTCFADGTQPTIRIGCRPGLSEEVRNTGGYVPGWCAACFREAADLADRLRLAEAD